jgi:hypothetical protein
LELHCGEDAFGGKRTAADIAVAGYPPHGLLGPSPDASEGAAEISSAVTSWLSSSLSSRASSRLSSLPLPLLSPPSQFSQEDMLSFTHSAIGRARCVTIFLDTIHR